MPLAFSQWHLYRLDFMVRPTRFERATYRVGVCHSIQLSYERICNLLHDYNRVLPESKAQKITCFRRDLQFSPLSRLFSPKEYDIFDSILNERRRSCHGRLLKIPQRIEWFQQK